MKKEELKNKKYINFFILLCASVLLLNFAIKTLNVIEASDYSDLKVFIFSGADFKATGRLYKRPDAGISAEELFRPTAGIFKFPPAFQLPLIPFADSTPPSAPFPLLVIIMAAIYIITCIATAKIAKKHTTGKDTGTSNHIFFLAATSAALTTDGFFSAIFLLNYEIVIFLLLITSFYLSEKKPVMSGAILSIISASKIYPCFMLIYFIATRNTRAVIGFFSGIIIITIVSLIVFGYGELHYYISEVLPILLREKVSDTFINLNIGKSISEIIGGDSNLIFSISKFLFISISIISIFENIRYNHKDNFKIFSLLLALMILCLPNYWSSYQILLLPGIMTFAADTSRKPTIPRLLTLILIIASLSRPMGQWLTVYPLDKDAVQVLTNIANTKRLITSEIIQLFIDMPINTFVYILEQIRSIVPVIILMYLAASIFQPRQLRSQQ